MKNKRLYQYWGSILLDMMISAILTGVTVIIGKAILEYSYIKSVDNFIIDIWRLWKVLKYQIYGEYISIGVMGLIFIVFYLIVTYRKTFGLVKIIEETEIMVKGDLDRKINIEAKGEIKELAENINSISKQLKEITIEERKAQQTKTDLITNVSHDLRTPLTSIMGYLEIIDNDRYRDEVALRYYANIAHEKSKSLNLLINDLFELTKMQNKTIKIEKQELNLIELLGQLMASFEYQFKCAHMEARANFTEDRLTVKADPLKLVRVFENLFSNGIKYGKEGYYIDIVAQSDGKNAMVQIINYGDAISPVDLPQIFDRFYRVEKSRNSSIGGSGLGLAIAKNIIELHEGTIKAYSDNEKTIFEVKLPLKEGE